MQTKFRRTLALLPNCRSTGVDSCGSRGGAEMRADLGRLKKKNEKKKERKVLGWVTVMAVHVTSTATPQSNRACSQNLYDPDSVLVYRSVLV